MKLEVAVVRKSCSWLFCLAFRLCATPLLSVLRLGNTCGLTYNVATRFQWNVGMFYVVLAAAVGIGDRSVLATTLIYGRNVSHCCHKSGFTMLLCFPRKQNVF